MEETIKIGIIGTDTSHSTAFAAIINDINHMHHVQGGQVIAAYPGGSPDFPLSMNRVEPFMSALEEQFGVRRAANPAEVAEESDALLLLSADGRLRLDQFRQLASFGKPVFIDKPFALSTADAASIQELARRHGTPIMSCSALRYADTLVHKLERPAVRQITSARASGPLAVEPTQSYFFWYGIHSIEALYAIMGTGCLHVQTDAMENHDLIIGDWRDGRVGSALLDRSGDARFTASIHHADETTVIDLEGSHRPFYASLLEHIMSFFRSGISPLDERETMEIIRFIEAAETSKASGGAVVPLF